MPMIFPMPTIITIFPKFKKWLDNYLVYNKENVQDV